MEYVHDVYVHVAQVDIFLDLSIGVFSIGYVA